MSELKVISLKCPSCGAKLQVSDDMDQFACVYCGSELTALRRGGTVSLKLITEAIAKVQVGTDKMAAELALVRLQKELDAAASEKEQSEKDTVTVIGQLHRDAEASTKRSPDYASGITLIGIAIGIIAFGITNAIFSPSGSAPLIAFVAACIAVGAFTYFIYRRRSQQVDAINAEIYRQIEEVRGEYERKAATLDTHIRDLQSKIIENKRIVNA